MNIKVINQNESYQKLRNGFLCSCCYCKLFSVFKKKNPIHERVKPAESTVCGPSVST